MFESWFIVLLTDDCGIGEQNELSDRDVSAMAI